MAPIRRIVIRAAIIGALLILWAISAAQSSARGAARESPAGGGARDAGTAMLRLATFDIDVTPPVGSMMAYDPVVRHDDLPLRCRGIVLSGAGQPIVLCAFDWIGIANESHDAVRDALAAAAKTVRSRVTVHTIHQHDAPVSDLLAEKLLRRAGAETGRYDGDLTRKVLRRLDAAVRRAVAHPRPVTHVGFGQADVERVASNRRILGEDGKVRVTRYTATRDAAVRAEPEGVIDPALTMVSFWNGDKPLAVLTYYACHPQSYYRTGIPSPDFPGIARFLRHQAVPDALPIHFDGAGGNIGAGKYNDGNPENRVPLALRLADGMKRAWEGTERFAVDPAMVVWSVESVALPPARHLDKQRLVADVARLTDPAASQSGASKLAWFLRCEGSHRVEIGMLKIGDVRILHLPGELFVEYQLAAKAMRPDLHVNMAAYGDYGPGYIGTERAYGEGGYETSPRASNVAPQVESVLMTAIEKLLKE